MNEIVWLDDPACRALPLAGGKAANLARLAGDFRVPPGFCLTTEAFARWSSPTDPTAGIAPGLASAYAELEAKTGRAGVGVAVRSSAPEEDGREASFAGQFETFLNRSGAAPVRDAVEACWASARSARVVEYRRRNGFAGPAAIAVLVQQLIAADASAVVFSANPITGDPDQVVVNCSWGLGESIVSGTVTPDTLVLDKASGAVVEARISAKQTMTVPVEGGTEAVPVPGFMRGTPSIDATQTAALLALARAAEEHFGHPVDIECAFEAGELYLLQCRPITTL